MRRCELTFDLRISSVKTSISVKEYMEMNQWVTSLWNLNIEPNVYSSSSPQPAPTQNIIT